MILKQMDRLQQYLKEHNKTTTVSNCWTSFLQTPPDHFFLLLSIHLPSSSLYSPLFQLSPSFSFTLSSLCLLSPPLSYLIHPTDWPPTMQPTTFFTTMYMYLLADCEGEPSGEGISRYLCVVLFLYTGRHLICPPLAGTWLLAA